MESSPYIDLSSRQCRLFKAAVSRPLLAEIDCDKALTELAEQRQRIAWRERNPSTTDWMLGVETRSFQKRVELFMPVAQVALLYELEGLLADPQKLNRDDS